MAVTATVTGGAVQLTGKSGFCKLFRRINSLWCIRIHGFTQNYQSGWQTGRETSMIDAITPKANSTAIFDIFRNSQSGAGSNF